MSPILLGLLAGAGVVVALVVAMVLIRSLEVRDEKRMLSLTEEKQYEASADEMLADARAYIIETSNHGG